MAVEGRNRKTPKRAPARPNQTNKVAQWGGIVTSLIKLGGLTIASNEALLNSAPHDAVVFGVAAFMMAGAQGIDSLLGSIFSSRPAKEES